MNNNKELENRLEKLSKLMNKFPDAMKGCIDRMTNEEDKAKIERATKAVEDALSELRPKKNKGTNPNE